jgi:hypothetical protein
VRIDLTIRRRPWYCGEEESLEFGHIVGRERCDLTVQRLSIRQIDRSGGMVRPDVAVYSTASIGVLPGQREAPGWS